MSDTDANATDDNILAANFAPTQSALCPGQTSYSFSLDRIPLLPTEAITNASDPEFNHGAGDNLIGIYFISKPVNPTAGQSKLYYKILKINRLHPEGFNLLPEDFKLMGSF